MAFRNLVTSIHWLHQRRFFRRPEGRLWVLMAIRLLKSSLSRLRPNRFFECPECRKCVRMAFRHQENRFIHINKVAFWDLQKTNYENAWPFAHLKRHLSDIIQMAFFMQRMLKMTSYGLSNPWNAASSTSAKSFLGRLEGRLCVLRAILLFKHHLSNLAQVAFYDSQNAETEFAWSSDMLNHRFIDINKVAF
jgi:uncharacterized C2H2 Zn-finger protein